MSYGNSCKQDNIDIKIKYIHVHVQEICRIRILCVDVGCNCILPYVATYVACSVLVFPVLQLAMSLVNKKEKQNKKELPINISVCRQIKELTIIR